MAGAVGLRRLLRDRSFSCGAVSGWATSSWPECSAACSARRPGAGARDRNRSPAGSGPSGSSGRKATMRARSRAARSSPSAVGRDPGLQPSTPCLSRRGPWSTSRARRVCALRGRAGLARPQPRPPRPQRAQAGRRDVDHEDLVDPHVLHGVPDRCGIPGPGAERPPDVARSSAVADRLEAGLEERPRAACRRDRQPGSRSEADCSGIIRQ